MPGAGWVEFDPTNGIVGNRDLIRVAVVRDPRQAVPLSGTWTGFPSDFLGMDVTVSVTSTPPSEEPSMPEAVDARRSRHRLIGTARMFGQCFTFGVREG